MNDMEKMCKIESQEFGLIEGEAIYLFRLINAIGLHVEIISYGATIKSINIPIKNGRTENIILGYDTLEGYLYDNNYLGATIGRFANRISDASFMMDDNTYYLDKNDGKNCNHGGFSGFDKKVFKCEVKEGKLTMIAESSHGEAGFPGNITLKVIYQLTDRSELFIDYHVSTDRKTPVNITNHAYFNLSGKETILDHQLRIESDRVLESDDNFLPTGTYINVKNNPSLDFLEFNRIGDAINLKSEKIKGYNTYFIAREVNFGMKKLAALKSEMKNRRVEVFSTMPGVMIYTGDYLSGLHTPLSGISLEAHYYPDSPNCPQFPQGIYAEGDNWKESIMYRFIG